MIASSFIWFFWFVRFYIVIVFIIFSYSTTLCPFYSSYRRVLFCLWIFSISSFHCIFYSNLILFYVTLIHSIFILFLLPSPRLHTYIHMYTHTHTLPHTHFPLPFSYTHIPHTGSGGESSALWRAAEYIKVFARMSPQGKAAVIRAIQKGSPSVSGGM